MLQWLCIIVLAVIAVFIPYSSAMWLPGFHDYVMESMLLIAIIGWIDSIWTNRQAFQRRLILLVFLGYTVWIIVTNHYTDFVSFTWRLEPVVFGAVVLLAGWWGKRHVRN